MNEWKRYYCPFCARRGKSPDQKGKLYINWSINRFLCFRCNTRGLASELDKASLVEFHGTSYVHDGVDVWDERRFINYSIEEVKERFPRVYDFLLRKNALKRFKVVSLVFFTYGYGLVIPITDDFFQIRVFSEVEKAPKYLTKRGFKKVEVMLGINQLKGDLVVIVEGIFDYYVLEGYAVCVFGRFISDRVVKQLITKGVKKFVVLWDEDSHLNSLEDAVKLWREYFVDAYAGFCLEGSPSDARNLYKTPCMRVTDGAFITLGELIKGSKK